MSTPDNRARAIFLEAIEEHSPEDRDEFVARACEGDAELRAKAERLLRSHEQLGSFHDARSPVEATELRPLSESPGTQIGPYKLLQQIGEGGMGVVFMAEQSEPVRRKVALKIIKPGMDTRQVIARFEAERQALSLMDHPNVARVLDAGTTQSGRPYFVMELVKGQPITQYCDEQHLTPRQRLELLLPVCQAIQHAHQKGIIHRDIKPTNILVAEYDQQPVPKMIDFGVAKAMAAPLTERTMFTGFGQIVGTLEYMSPEQAKVNQLDIDTRSDIYSLGVLMYELLTGSTPFDGRRLRAAAFDEMLRIIREEEPPKPSTRLSESRDSLPSISAQRQIEPARLTKLVRGELDWIVMKALEKDRNRRYETASGLAADIQHYLSDEPVVACPPSATYRFRKFALRNRRVLVTAGLFALVMVAGTAISLWQALLARRAEAKANDAAFHERTSAQQAREERNRAEELGGIARTERSRAEARELLARHHLIAAQMNLAEQEWELGNCAEALKLLERQRPVPGETDLRSFDWYYLWRICHSGHKFTLRGHRGAVRCTALSPDGKTLATGGIDRLVKLWDVATGQGIGTLEGHTVLVESVAFLPDGKVLVSGGGGPDDPGEVKMWDLSTQQVLSTFAAHPRGIRSLAVSPDGTMLATSSHDQTVKVWDLATRQKVRDFAVAQNNGKLFMTTGWLGSVVFSPDSKTLAAASTTEPKIVRLWDLATGNERMALPGAYGCPLAISPDGKLLATLDTQGPHVVKLWDAASGEMRSTFMARAAVCSLAFSHDSEILAYGTGHGDVTLRRLATGEERRRAHLGAVWSLALSADGKTLATASADGTAKLWNVSQLLQAPIAVERIVESQAPQAARMISVAFSGDGKLLAVGSDLATGETPGGYAKVWKWNGQAWEEHCTVKHSDGVIWSVVFSPAGDTLATGGDGVKLWDVSTGKERMYLKVPDGMFVPSVAFSPDGRTLATGAQVIGDAYLPSPSMPADVKVWDVATGRQLANLTGHLGDAHVAYAPDGQTLAVGGFASAVSTIWSTGTCRPVVTFSGVQRVVFSPDGRRWGVRSLDEIVELPQWESPDFGGNPAKGQETQIDAPIDSRTLPFAPDGKTLVAWRWGENPRLWDVVTGQERLTLRGHVGHIWSMAFSPDGAALAAVGDGGGATLWRAATERDVLVQSSVDPALELFRQNLALAIVNARGGRYQEAIANFDKALELDSKSVEALNDLAWLLTTCPDAGFRDVSRALELAGKAVALEPRERTYWNTLGVARYRAGDWENAIQALEKSWELGKGGDSFDWFFLAMAHWRLGNKAEAHNWFGQAVQWMDANRPNDEELLRFRHEAAELLGIHDQRHEPAEPAVAPVGLNNSGR